ncbi:hypothetical protein CC86DRAFT_365784 [Ophiobolus disseminans]|uniref:Uncharacterized protein n=1 Tax=Ophiobolus disseminans TaxID=1469910 RepID=A0A6A7AGK1_9PLEO|nr:hypothetical protein CC86DRAFT_365784 [Ophiobolus disseminans]
MKFCRHSSHRPDQPAQEGLSQWLLTNKTTFTGGLKQLDYRGYMVIRTEGFYYDLSTFPTLYHPSSCRAVQFTFNPRAPVHAFDGAYIGELHPADTKYCSKLLVDTRAGGKLRSLELRIMPSDVTKLHKRVYIVPLGTEAEVVAHLLNRLEIMIYTRGFEDKHCGKVEEMLRGQIDQLDKGPLAGMAGGGGKVLLVRNFRGKVLGWKIVWGRHRWGWRLAKWENNCIE